MEPGRRSTLAQLCVVLSVAAGCIPAGWFLPEAGPLGLVAWVLACVGVMAMLAIPFAVWAVIAPGAARRWEEDPRAPVPLPVPIFWWLLIGAAAWALTHIEPPTARADDAGLTLLWCGWCGGFAFAVAFSVMYLRGRRRTAGGVDDGSVGS
jgi:hypothetical protein